MSNWHRIVCMIVRAIVDKYTAQDDLAFKDIEKGSWYPQPAQCF